MPRAARIGGILLAVLFLLVALYAALGYWVVPRVLESRVESLLADELSLEARFERVAFDPFDLRLEVDGFTLGPPGGEPTAGLAELRLDVEALRVLRRRVIVEELHLGGPRVTLRVDEQGALWLAGVPLASDAAQAEPAAGDGDAAPEPDDEGAPLVLDIRRLSLSDGRVRLEDATRRPAFARELGPIDLAATDLEISDLIGGPPGAHSPAELAIDLGEGAAFSARGDVDVAPLRLDLELALSALPLASLQPYLASIARVDVESGRLDGQGRLRVAVDPTPAVVRFQGSLSVSSLELVEPEGGEPLLAWKRLDLSELDLVSEPPAISVARIRLAEPAVRVVQAPSGLNWARAFETDAEDSAPASDPEPDPSGPETGSLPPLAVGPVELSGGRLLFEDRGLEPAYDLELSELSLEVDGFRADPEARSTLELRAAMDGYAPLSVTGSLAPLAPQDYLDLRLRAEGLELSSLSPYTGRYVGRRIDAGRGSATIEMRVQDHRLESQNDFVFEKLDFGARVKSPTASSLPVAAAASLAADADGRISIGIPIAGDLDDPGFSYGRALFDAFRALVTRIVATPFKLVGGMVSYGGRLFRPEEMSQVAFEPEQDDLSQDEKTQLDALAEALRANPGLRVEVVGGADPTLDEEEGDDLRVLARRRARAVRERLEQAGVEAERISLGELVLGPEAVFEGRVITRLGVR